MTLTDLTVGQLIDQLKPIPHDSKVYVELGEAEFNVTAIHSGTDGGGRFCVLVIE